MFKPLYNPQTLTCTITIGDWKPCEGVQKLIGFAKGLSFHRVPYFPYFHHSNNIRLGYNRDSWESPVRLFMYAYVNKNRVVKMLGEFNIGVNVLVDLQMCKSGYYAVVYNQYMTLANTKIKFKNPHKTLPLGYLLGNYAELDGPKNEQIAFKVDIKDLKVNGKMIKI